MLLGPGLIRAYRSRGEDGHLARKPLAFSDGGDLHTLPMFVQIRIALSYGKHCEEER